jgi:phospholipid/cholesterol/gamma-HCH transport system substrate-binding protein
VKTSRAVIAVLAVVGVVLGTWAAYQWVYGNPGGPTWTAEFSDARGLVVGNDIRDDGAVVGRVTSIGLSHNGLALVRFQLFDRVAAPRADAVAAIEPADLLGDTYMSLSPGSSRARLQGPIDPSHTVNAPRLDQVLDAFQPNVRDGLQTLLVEGGLALDQHGGALARATVALRPALQAAQGVLRELDTQDGSLARMLGPVHALVREVDSRRADLGPLLDGLARTVGATAGASSSLGQGLSGLPAMLQRLRSASSGLASLTSAATPVVARIEPLTGELTDAAKRLPPLLERVQRSAPTFRTVLGQARKTLAAGEPGLSRLSSAFPVLRQQAPTIDTVMSEFDRAMPGIAQGFFVDFPDQADESGRQPFDPFADPRRAYWRGAAVFSCEAFGVPVRPGCLARALANLIKQPPPKTNAARQLLGYLLHR